MSASHLPEKMRNPGSKVAIIGRHQQSTYYCRPAGNFYWPRLSLERRRFCFQQYNFWVKCTSLLFSLVLDEKLIPDPAGKLSRWKTCASKTLLLFVVSWAADQVTRVGVWSENRVEKLPTSGPQHHLYTSVVLQKHLISCAYKSMSAFWFVQ